MHFDPECELVPDVPEPIVGYRGWTHQNDRLIGWQQTIWPYDQPLHAVCRGTHLDLESVRLLGMLMGRAFVFGDLAKPDIQHRCPSTNRFFHTGYGCGIYAFKELDGALQQHRDVVGEVQMWGRVFEHGVGYRAEIAEPIKLCWTLDGPERMRAERLAELYGVPCEEIPDTAAAAEYVAWRAMWEGHQEDMARLRQALVDAQRAGLSTEPIRNMIVGKVRQWLKF